MLTLNIDMFQHNIELIFPSLNEECSAYQLATNPVIQVLEVSDLFFFSFLHAKTFYSGGE